MADKIDTNMMHDAGANMSSDRARRINSLHRSVEDLVQEQNKKRLQVSTEVSSLTKEQQKMMDQLNAERGAFTNQTASAYDNVVRSLGKTIQNLSIGVKNITMDTAKATSGAIGEYGRAVGEDININKQNTMAMALSRATPLFGYFAAKFMETDVFKGAAERMKERATSAFASVGTSIGNLFRKKKAAEDESDYQVPHMQTGGFVKKGGIVEVHAAEVVTPIDKLLKQIDEAKSQEISKKLEGVLTSLSHSMVRMETLVEAYQDDKKDMIGTFVSEFRKAGDYKQKSWQDRMLKAILELKVAMVGTASRLRIAWQRTILQHPVFRNLLMFGQTMESVVKSPFKFFFGLRGGFGGEARRATRTSNIYQQQVNMLVLIYTKGMTFLRNIERYSKVTAEALVGQEVSPVANKTYTLFGKVKEMMTSRGITSLKEDAFNHFVTSLGLDRSALKEAGITSFTDLLAPGAILRKMGVTAENIRGKMTEGPQSFGAGTEAAKKKFSEMADNISKMTKMKKDQEEREGPHSPSMAENIAATSTFTEKKYKEDKKTDKERLSILDKIKGYGRTQAEKMGGLAERFKKMGKGIKGWFPVIFGFMSRIGGYLYSMVKPIITLASTVGMFFASQFGKLLMGGGRVLGGLFGGATSAAASGGASGVAGWAAKGAAGAAGTVASVAVGGLIGGWMSMKDMITAIRDPEAFAGGVLTRAFSAVLGGAGEAGKGGYEGAKRGVLKGAALGAAAGSIIPGVGTMIGGAIGALAGGILGFVGGEKISEYMNQYIQDIKGIVSSIWSVATFPYKLLKEGIKSFWVLTKFLGKKIFGWLDEWLSGPGFVGEVWTGVKSIFSSIFDAFGTLFTVIKDGIKNIFSGFDMGTLKEFMKEALVNMMFPLVGFMKAFRGVREWADKKIEAIPIIGAMYKKSKGIVKDISEGNLANKLEAALESTDKPVVQTITSPRKRKEKKWVTEMRLERAQQEKILDALGVNGIRYKNGVLTEVNQNGKWRPATADERQVAFLTKGSSTPNMTQAQMDSMKNIEKPNVVTHVNSRKTTRQLKRLRDKNILVSKGRIMDSIGASAIRFANGQLHEVQIGGKWRRATPEEIQIAQEHTNAATIATNKAIKQSQLAGMYAQGESTKSAMVTNKLDETTAKLTKSMDNASKSQTQATISSANIISSSNQNVINNNSNSGGGGGWGGGWNSGSNGVAEQVAAANIN